MTNSVVRPTRITTMPSTAAPAPLTMTSACTAHLVAALHLYRRRPVVRQPGTGARVVAREGLCGRESLPQQRIREARLGRAVEERDLLLQVDEGARRAQQTDVLGDRASLLPLHVALVLDDAVAEVRR